MDKKMWNSFLAVLFLTLLYALPLSARIDQGSWGTITLNVGEKATLTEQVDTRYGSITAIRWVVATNSGSRQTVRIIEGEYSNSCVIEAFQAGDGCKVECWYTYKASGQYSSGTNDCIAHYKIVVNSIPVEGIAVSPASVSLREWETAQLSYTISPSNATNKWVLWSSSDESVATVSSSGLVTAKKSGSATITCKADDGSGKQGSCTVTVTPGIRVKEITLNYTELSLSVDDWQNLYATVLPDSASNKEVIWTSSNENVAELNSWHQVHAIAEGTATITCKATDGSGVQATCEVSVYKHAPGTTFKAKTVEGIEMTFRVDGANSNECMVDSYCIDQSTTGTVTIPAEADGLKVTAISNSAFHNCKGITKVNIPNTVTLIDRDAFTNCI